ncbi:MAG: 4-(cytidine 5'-diphospho)-2-C-methyl-D-erythritol kinase [candidate division Zixibacteria bacterium]|nr:4-(cytidine 5'-diphospho)-2-C-methyl-D-erythritol kinase [candidate division Zixibacteria bacterium]
MPTHDQCGQRRRSRSGGRTLSSALIVPGLENIRSVTVAERCRILSPAKINLGLTVQSRRDDGFHELSTVLVALNLYDELDFVADSDGGIRLRVASLHDHEQSRSEFPTDESNLIVRALRALEREIDHELHLHITIKKAIPIAAGLGGGSSNAAAAFRAASLLYDLDVGEERLAKLAGSVGSDVPFFLNGPSALATGRGEIIRPVSLYSDWWVILIIPPFHLSTAEIYRQLTLTYRDTKNSFHVCGDEEGFFAALRQCRNDLEVVATSRHPELFRYMQQLREAGAEGAFVTGSGPTVVGVFREWPGNDTVETLQTRNEGVRVLTAQPVDTPDALVVQMVGRSS